jgi:hypothetical protein
MVPTEQVDQTGLLLQSNRELFPERVVEMCDPKNPKAQNISPKTRTRETLPNGFKFHKENCIKRYF